MPQKLFSFDLGRGGTHLAGGVAVLTCAAWALGSRPARGPWFRAPTVMPS